MPPTIKFLLNKPIIGKLSKAKKSRKTPTNREERDAVMEQCLNDEMR